jgi:ABC-type glutathione transport system ATPase component
LSCQPRLAGRRHDHPCDLTEGERRRAALARALLGRPSVLLADEPAADLPPGEAASLLALLRDAAREDGIAVVLFTRDEDVPADTVVAMVGGRVAGVAASAPAALAA